MLGYQKTGPEATRARGDPFLRYKALNSKRGIKSFSWFVSILFFASHHHNDCSWSQLGRHWTQSSVSASAVVRRRQWRGLAWPGQNENGIVDERAEFVFLVLLKERAVARRRLRSHFGNIPRLVSAAQAAAALGKNLLLFTCSRTSNTPVYFANPNL